MMPLFSSSTSQDLDVRHFCPNMQQLLDKQLKDREVEQSDSSAIDNYVDVV